MGSSWRGRNVEESSQVLHQPRREDVVDEPFASLLSEDDVASEASCDQHLMRGLENALKMRRVSLSEWELLGELIECDSPRHCSVLTRNLEQTIQPSRDGGREREVT